MNNNRQSRSLSRQSLSRYPSLIRSLSFSLSLSPYLFFYFILKEKNKKIFLISRFPGPDQTRPESVLCVCASCGIVVACAPSTQSQSSPSFSSYRIPLFLCVWLCVCVFFVLCSSFLLTFILFRFHCFCLSLS